MRTLAILVLTMVLAGCRPSSSTTRPTTERQRDSAIGASQLPGAQGVRGALRVSDSADARRAWEDSAAQ
jgi:nitrous oxide reductase accessory protein NosL